MEQPTRPPQVTTAVMAVVFASAFLVISAFDGVGGAGSLETRATLAKALSDPVFKQVGFTVDDATIVIRLAWTITAMAAAACFVLAFYVYSRHEHSRIALALCVVPIIALAPFAGGLFAAILAVGAALMWTRPVRDWFAGHSYQPPDQSGQR